MTYTWGPNVPHVHHQRKLNLGEFLVGLCPWVSLALCFLVPGHFPPHPDLPPPKKTLPAHNHELLLRCPRPDVIPEVHGEDGAGTIKDGGEGGHERRHHNSNHEPTEPWGQKGGLWASGFFCSQPLPSLMTP